MFPAAKKSNRSTAAAIPEDVVIDELLLRLPLKSVARFKCVRRSWLAALEEPSFTRRHLELSRATTTPPLSVLIVPRLDKGIQDYSGEVSDTISFHRLHPLDESLHDETSDFEPELMLEAACPLGKGITHAVLPTHCDGLVAIATATDQVYVCNPATKEFVALPLGTPDAIEFKEPAAAIGFDPWRNRHVVSRYFYRSYDEYVDEDTGVQLLEYDIGHEIFVLGGGGGDGSTWELTDDPPHAIGRATAPVCVGGAFYWSADKMDPNALLRFSLRDWEFDIIPCPPGVRGSFCYGDYLAELGGKLCLVHLASEAAYDLWELDDADGGRWSMRCRVDVSDDESIGVDGFLPLATFGKNDLLLAVDGEVLYRTNGGESGDDERIKEVEEMLDLDELEYNSDVPSPTRYHVIPYVESLHRIRARN